MCGMNLGFVPLIKGHKTKRVVFYTFEMRDISHSWRWAYTNIKDLSAHGNDHSELVIKNQNGVL